MTPPATEELLNVIMLDDFVARRKALDTWTRRWVATAEVVTGDVDHGHTTFTQCMALGAALFRGEVHAVEHGRSGARMHVLLQKPRELE